MGTLLRFALAFLFPIVASQQCAVAAPIVNHSGYEVQLLADGIGAATGVTVGEDQNLYVTDYAGGRILRVDLATSFPAAPEVIATGIAYPTDIAMLDGRLFVSSSTGPSSHLYEIGPGGTSESFTSGFSYPISLAAFGNTMYVTNGGDGMIVRVDVNGDITPFVSGFGGPHGPFGISFDAAGNAYIVVHGTGSVYKVAQDGTATFIGQVSPFGGVFTGVIPDHGVLVSDVLDGSLYLLLDGEKQLFASGFAGKTNAPFNGPNDIAVDGDGTIYVADADHIWRISPIEVSEPPTIALLLGILATGFRRKGCGWLARVVRVQRC